MPVKIWSATSPARKIDINITGRAPKLDPEKPFTTKQADAILELQLHRLTRLSIDEIIKELTTIKDEIAEYESILGSEAKLRKRHRQGTRGDQEGIR